MLVSSAYEISDEHLLPDSARRLPQECKVPEDQPAGLSGQRFGWKEEKNKCQKYSWLEEFLSEIDVSLLGSIIEKYYYYTNEKQQKFLHFLSIFNIRLNIYFDTYILSYKIVLLKIDKKWRNFCCFSLVYYLTSSHLFLKYYY